MSYNLLFDTSFESNNNWKYTNCRYENGYLISSDQIFGIEQTLTLANKTKLYFRWDYKIFDSNIKEILIGIQNGKILNVNRRYPRLNRKQSISLIDIAKQETITVHLIFESKEKINKVKIDNPILVDLNQGHKSTWLKYILDKHIFFMNGYTYSNLYEASELNCSLNDFNKFQFEEAKVGIITTADQALEIPLNCNLTNNHYYLIKLDYEEINKLGEIKFNYGAGESIKIENNQIYLVFKANNIDKLTLNINSNDVLPYKINLKHILLIDISHLKLKVSDVAYLPFI